MLRYKEMIWGVVTTDYSWVLLTALFGANKDTTRQICNGLQGYLAMTFHSGTFCIILSKKYLAFLQTFAFFKFQQQGCYQNIGKKHTYLCNLQYFKVKGKFFKNY